MSPQAYLVPCDIPDEHRRHYWGREGELLLCPGWRDTPETRARPPAGRADGGGGLERIQSDHPTEEE